jgi:hypothetical protein
MRGKLPCVHGGVAAERFQLNTVIINEISQKML